MNQFLSSSLQDQLVSHPKDIKFELNDFRSLFTDSRAVVKGGVFLPIIGEKFNGHSFIRKSLTEGARLSFCSEEHIDDHKDLSDQLIVVQDTLQAFQALAKAYVNSKDAIRIGITGSAGKTTMKNMVYAMCAPVADSIATPRSYNNEIGVPKTCQLIKESTKYAVLELAARHVGDIKYLTRMVQPNVAICLNVGTAHLGEFGSLENILNTKMEIYHQSPEDTLFIVNGDDKRIIEHIRILKQPKIFFGHEVHNDVRIKETSDKTVELSYKNEVFSIPFATAHATNSMNAAAAFAIAVALKFDLNEASKRIGQFEGDAGRFSIEKLGRETTFIDDSYNANPDSMKLGLQSITEEHPDKGKTLILGKMLELGEESAQFHKNLSPVIKSVPKLNHLITIGEDAQLYAESIAKDTVHQHFNDIEYFKAFFNDNKKMFLSSELIYTKASLGVGLHDFVPQMKGAWQE